MDGQRRRGLALVNGKRRLAAIKLERIALKTGYETRPGRIDALKYTVAYTRVWDEGKIIIVLRKQSPLARSLSRRFCALEITMQIRWLTLRADDDKTQILTPTALKRKRERERE